MIMAGVILYLTALIFGAYELLQGGDLYNGFLTSIESSLREQLPTLQINIHTVAEEALR